MAQQFDLIIVGAGMVGATLACALADAPMRIALVDRASLASGAPRAPTDSGYDPRVSAISAASENILKHVGAWQRIPAQRRAAYRHMRVWDADGTGEIGFDADSLGESRLGHIVENHLIQDALLDALESSAVTLFGERRVEGLVREPVGWRLLFETGEALQAPLIVAADGARSKLRELAGFPMREWDYLHDAVVTTVQTERPHQATAWQRFMPTGPLALLPLNDQQHKHYCSIVWSLLPEQAERIMNLDDDAFCHELGQAFESRLGPILACDTRHRIALRQRHARRYAMPGLVLIGDAAHSIHPLAGQGVNLGLLDAAELHDTLRAAWQRGEGLGELAVLQRYERRRMGANLGMMAAMEGFERLFHADALPLRWVRNAGMRLLDGQGLIKGGIMRRAMGLAGDLPALAKDPELAGL